MSEDDYISFHRPCIGEEEIREVSECLRSGWLTTGARAKTFEAEFATYIGAKFAVALNSCTAALHLALEAIGLKENELVLVPTLTFAATAEVVRYFNAIPVMVDSSPEDRCMDMKHASEILELLEKGQKVKGVPEKHGLVRAMIPVHFGGQMADVLACRKLCDRYGLNLVEDCAHICPAYYQDSSGKWTMGGRTADIACFSFYANKTITTGEGGMAVTDNQAWEERMRIMSLHGISKDAWKRFSKSGSWFYEIIAPGFKYNITDIAASIGIHQLKKADHFLEERRKIAEKYVQLMSDIPGIELPKERIGTQSSWHLFIIDIDKEKAGIQRNDLIEKLKSENIGTSVHYIPLHLHPYYRERFDFSKGDFPVAEKYYETGLSLPIYPGLSESEISRVAETIRKIINTRG